MQNQWRSRSWVQFHRIWLFSALSALSAVDAFAVSPQEIADPHRELENPAAPTTQAFYATQDAQARARLDALPGRTALLARIRSLSEFHTRVTHLQLAGNRVFYLKEAPGRTVPALMVREGFSGAEKAVVEPDRHAGGGEGAVIAGYAASPDGRHVAYGLARAGGDAVLRVREVATGRDVSGAIERARLDEGLAWHPDGRSFYYAKRTSAEEPRRHYAALRIHRHVLGRDAGQDEVVFAPGVGGAREVPDFALVALRVPLESAHAYALVREGTSRDLAIHVTAQRDLAAGQPRWRQIVSPADGVIAMEAWREDLLLLTHKGAPRNRVLLLSASQPDLARAKEAVPEGDLVLEAIGLAKEALYLKLTLGGVARLERVTVGPLGGRRKPEFLKTPFDNQVAELVTDPRRPGALIRFDGFIEAPSIRELDARTGDLRDTKLQPPPVADFGEIDEVRLQATGHDGTRLPVTLLYRKSTTLTGDNPTLLVGQGSHGLALTGAFDPARLAWLERGGVLAFAHVRGGGEFGEPWHRAGRRVTKANTVLDFIAAAEFIVQYGFTSPKRLVVSGEGAGAIAAGGQFARRPELAAGAVLRAPWTDLVRAEHSAGGALEALEFGTSARPAEAAVLHALSPYHQVREGVAYPGTLLLAGLQDPRVPPWQAARLAARLQGLPASPAARPVLLRTAPSVDERATGRRLREELLADVYAFALWQVGDPAFQPPAPPPVPLPASSPPTAAPKSP